MMLDFAWITLSLLVLITIVALVRSFLLQSRLTKLEKNSGERISKLENELSAMLDGNLGMGNQLSELQRDLKDAKEKLQQLEQRDLGAMPYNQAVRLVSNGATVDQLINQCGLSRSEADLIMLLHKNSPPVIEPLGEAWHEGFDTSELSNMDKLPERDQPPIVARNEPFGTAEIKNSLTDEFEDIDEKLEEDEPIENQERIPSSIERASQSNHE